MGAETQWWWVTPVTLLVIAVVGGLAKLVHWMGQIDEHRGTVGSFMEEIRGELRTIRGQIADIFQLLPEPTTAGASPRQLTDSGREVAAQIDAYEWARTLAPTLTDEVAGEEPFQIDRFCERYVEQRLSDEMTTRVAQYVYESGRVRARVLSVLHVVLRDELLRLASPDPK